MKVLSGIEAKSAYRSFCRQHTDLPIFAQDWYLDHCSNGSQWHAVVLIHDQEIIATYTYFLKKKWLFQYVTMPMFVKWMGLYTVQAFRTPKWEARILRSLLPHLPKADRLQQNFFPSSFNWSPLYWNNFKQTTYYTYQLDLRIDREELFSRIQYNTRRSILQADFVLDTAITPTDFYTINKMSFARQNLSVPYRYDLFITHCEALISHDSCQLLGARNTQGQLCAVCCLIWDQSTCYYHFSGDHPDFREQSVGIWMIWEAVLFAYEKLSVATFDFEGSMLEGVATVKQRFRAMPIPYYYISQDQHFFFKLLSALSIIRRQ
jgi:hypothetical protein